MDEPVENAASLLHPQPASLLPRKLKSKGANALLLFVFLFFVIRSSLLYLSPFEPIDSTKDFALREGGDAASAREHSLLCDRGERGSQRPRSVKDKVESTGRHFARILGAAFLNQEQNLCQ
jgi:hypothetical protein